MSDYGQGAIDLMGILGVDAEDVVGDLMVKLKNSQEFANNQIRDLQEKLRLTKEGHKAHLELIDYVAARNSIKVLCSSCDEYYPMDFELSLYDPQHSYCGGSDRCCP